MGSGLGQAAEGAVEARGGVEVGGGVEGVRRATGERATADGRQRRRQRRSWIWGKWPWGRTNPVVKSEIAVAHSRKSAAATLATARSGIHATATPFSFPPFSFSFLHILFFFLSPYSISFIFNYLSIFFPFNFISFSSSEFWNKTRCYKRSSGSAVQYGSLLLCVAYRLSRGNFSSNVFRTRRATAKTLSAAWFAQAHYCYLAPACFFDPRYC